MSMQVHSMVKAEGAFFQGLPEVIKSGVTLNWTTTFLSNLLKYHKYYLRTVLQHPIRLVAKYNFLISALAFFFFLNVIWLPMATSNCFIMGQPHLPDTFFTSKYLTWDSLQTSFLWYIWVKNPSKVPQGCATLI